MTFQRLVALKLSLFFALLAAPVHAQPAEKLTQNWFYAETGAGRAAALAGLEAAEADDNAARFGRASVTFFTAVEGLMQDLYRYGYNPPNRSGFVPELRYVIPENPAPETLTYDDFRAVLERFATGMEEARTMLAEVDPDDPVGIEIDFTTARLDVTGAEAIPPEATIAAVFAQMQSRRRRPRNRDAEQPEQPAAPVFRFDNADAIWLEGYSNVLLASVDFFLAHDFRRAFDNSFHVFFPRSGLPLQEAFAPPRKSGARRNTEAFFADFITLIHLADMPVIEPARRAHVIDRFREVARLSRADWAAIRAETDNYREWLPGPHQPDIHPLTGVRVTETMVDGWMDALDLLDGVMSGDRLLPHWRFPARGMNMKTFFEGTENFDPVLLVTGPGALPYIEEGDVVTRDEWRAIRNIIGRRNFFMIATWFN